MKVEIVEEKRKIGELLVLEMEINGVERKNEKGEVLFFHPGLRNQRLSATIKYYLNKLSKKLESESKSYNELRNEMLKKYGEEEEINGQKTFSIKHMIEDPNQKNPNENPEGYKPKMIVNPKLEEFRKEERELLETEVTIKMPKFAIEDLFNFETEYDFNSCYAALIKDDENADD